MEEKLKNLKVGMKLRTGFKNIIIGMLLIVLAATVAVAAIMIQFKKFYDESYQNDVLQMEIRKDIQLVGKMVLWSLVADNDTETNERLNQADVYAEAVMSNIALLEENFHNKAIVSELEEAVTELKASRAQLVELSRSNKKEEAIVLFDAGYTKATERVQDILIRIGQQSEASADIEYIGAVVTGVVSAAVIILVSILSLFYAIKIEKIIIKLLMVPIEQLENAAYKLQAGELEIDIPYESEDELGVLANSFRVSCDRLHEIVKDAGYLLTEMANGNFNISTRIEDKYVGEFKTIIMSMRKLNRQMDATLRSINESSDQVAIGSAQLAESAQALAEGATDQAGAIEELTATIENVSNIAENTANEAEGAANMAREAAANAENSRSDLVALTDAMKRINETSREIQNIIADIEDIASQTNLLSLNASIEAARAGEAGKGFAVVADQIGKLADDSAKSAVNTRELIEKALLEIEDGNAITEKTVEALNDILGSMKMFAEAAGNSNEVSKNQARMLQEIEKAIEQISEVVQSNSASAEETSATSEELSAQSENLKELVAQFKLRED